MWTGLLHWIETHVLSFDTVVIVATWISALLGAALAYGLQAEERPKTLRGFRRFCFPAAILRHPSCRLDAAFVAAAHFLRPPAIIMVGNLAVAELTYAGLVRLFGVHTQHAEPVWLWLLILVVCVVVQDFMTFIVHVWQHQSRSLWELHKVHHSTEFLIPISNLRFHPAQAVVDDFGTNIPVGLVLGLTSYVFALPVHDNSVIGLDAYFIANLLSFYHLRHSHIALRYGWLERHLMSPAQHQIHHSREERHWDRNFGLCFSWWDRWFGTIVYSAPQERFALGLPRDTQGEYDSAAKLFWTPLHNLGAMADGALRRAFTLPATTRPHADVPAPPG
jgi:sterol desaturase/sphingolipid hydroxylase (fatty acid hydroxylase superfamily)